ncbi:MAG TPA: asparaginase [Phycisphaerae bacterium]|nr:asparaginase [Phycisphaerae bacterium]
MGNLKPENAVARVYILYTGGTIGMVPEDPDNPASPLVPANEDELKMYVPGLGEKEGIHWEIGRLVDEKGDDVPPLDSSDVNSEHWIYMATSIEKVYDEFDGFVILHGTDTMAYTASGLSFLLANLAKPVVITGSQLPICQTRTDAVQNFVNALYIAGYKATGFPLVPEVTICFGDVLLRGNRTRKVSTASWQGFDTPNFPKLGTIGEHIRINTNLVRPPADNEKAPFFAHKTLVSDVMDMGLFPGLRATQLERLLGMEGLKGIVLRTFGAGNAPSYDDFLDVIGKAIRGEGQGGRLILNVTQCVEGMVEMGLYAASSGLLERGVISGLDMTPEAALAKLMWILATESDPEEIQKQLQINQRGEQSQNLFDVRYGGAGKKSEPQAIVKVSARPSGQFDKTALHRAVLRISGVGFADTAEGEDVGLRVFINLPGATADTPTADPHFAAAFEEKYKGPKGTRFLREVTAAVNRVVESGRPINITLVPMGGKKIWYDGLYLALFCKA